MTGWILAAVAAALALAAGAYRAGAAGRRAPGRARGVPPGDAPAGEAAEREAVLVSLARRLHSLVHQEIRLVASLAARVEDPELRKGLLAIDHVATRMRHQTESLAIVGGAVPPRQWSGPAPVQELLRAAVAEVEHYPRVRIAPPVPGAVRPAAAGDIIHLVAELIDNATRFSPPQARTVLRAEVVRAGLAVEVEDRGPGLPPPERQRLNALLAAPEGQASGLLDGGRVGLFVVASLARRHGIRVELNTSVYGGTQAVVVLPPELAGTVEPADAPAARPAALLGPAAPRPAVPPQPS
ncbi:MAG: sensor histidine kinase, partial [Nocardiopsaceae bacterium]|nr:sensor histidine kinase [Nocardiopsaceae bacterium]